MLRDNTTHQHLAARRGDGGHVGACLDLVGDDGIGTAVERLHAVYADRIGTGAADVGAHEVQEVCQVDDVRLLRRVFDDGGALGQRRRHHDVHRRAHGDDVEVDVRALHVSALGVGDDIVALAHGGAHGGEALDVLVDGTHAAEVAAAGHRDLGAAEAPQQGADQIIGGAQLVRQILRDMCGVDVPTIDLHVRGIEKAHVCAETFQNFQKHRHVRDLGDVFDAHNAVHQQRGGNDGDRCVFGAADVHLAVQRTAASNDIFLHISSLISGITA